MEEYEAAKLRMQCLELAKNVAVAQASGLYSVVDDAAKYWAFVGGAVAANLPKKNEDDIPF